MPPWSSSGSLVSDRIRSNPSLPKQHQQNKGKGAKGSKAPTPEPPKSQATRVLETCLDGARRSNGHSKDPKGGCFCQARKHTLSSYVLMCQHCGLILCALNQPYFACPHCSSALLDERTRDALVGRLEAELAEQLAREEAKRQRAIEEARAAEGAFPMLPGAQANTQLMRVSRTPPPLPATRTVLSLNSETKRVTVSSYSTPTATLSRLASREEDRAEEERVLGPPAEASLKGLLDLERPWRSALGEDHSSRTRFSVKTITSKHVHPPQPRLTRHRAGHGLADVYEITKMRPTILLDLKGAAWA
ncbi:hypothetical protein JVU11DRAFT_3953 [Chiua virens]|nr:hypothetical protein JVU11DRAFT_3953 [Chiua virens]